MEKELIGSSAGVDFTSEEDASLSDLQVMPKAKVSSRLHSFGLSSTTGAVGFLVLVS